MPDYHKYLIVIACLTRNLFCPNHLLFVITNINKVPKKKTFLLL